MKRAWIVGMCAGVIVLLAAVFTVVKMQGRRGQTAHSWQVAVASPNIDEHTLSENKLQPIWFGPPRTDIPQTLEEITDQLRRSPASKEIIIKAAIKAAQRGKWDVSLQYARRWIDLAPREVDAYICAVHALVNLGRASEAVELLVLARRRADGDKLRLHQYNAVEGDVHLFLALEAKRSSQESYETSLKRAEALYKEAQQAGNFSIHPAVGLLRVSLERNDVATAQKILTSLYQEGVNTRREQVLIAYYQGVVLERQGDLGKAREYYRAAVTTDPASFAVER